MQKKVLNKIISSAHKGLGLERRVKNVSYASVAVMTIVIYFFLNFYLFMIVTEREREREAETQAKGEAGSTHGA